MIGDLHLPNVSLVLSQVSITGSESNIAYYILGVYVSGVVISLGWLLYRIFQLRSMIRERSIDQSFSFFSWIRIQDGIEHQADILYHEQIHAKQLHSLDVLFFELVKAVNWFNPVVYLYANSVKLNHEYIADSGAIREVNSADYARLLVDHAIGGPDLQLCNNFFSKSLLKKRIHMLFKKKSSMFAYSKLLLLMPILFVMLACQKPSGLMDSQALLASETSVFPQDTSKLQEEETQVLFLEAETMPEPLGGMDDFMKYIANNFEYPNKAVEAGVAGRMIIQFVVDKDGSITDITPLRPLEHGMTEEAIRVLSNSPKWKPGIQNGRPVRVEYTLPLVFNVGK